MLTVVLLLTLGVCAAAYVLGQALGRRTGLIAAAGLCVAAGLLVRAWMTRGGDGAEAAVSEVWPWLPSFDVALRLREDVAHYRSLDKHEPDHPRARERDRDDEAEARKRRRTERHRRRRSRQPCR